jgi:hypothetical protein
MAEVQSWKISEGLGMGKENKIACGFTTMTTFGK